jgi:hypothetical protein
MNNAPAPPPMIRALDTTLWGINNNDRLIAMGRQAAVRVLVNVRFKPFFSLHC